MLAHKLLASSQTLRSMELVSALVSSPPHLRMTKIPSRPNSVWN